MVFSTLFHACDQDVFSFCLMKYSVLQFCDYYSTAMSLWVTVLAMGGLPEQAKSLLHMAGAVGLALAIEYNRTGVFTFMVPAAMFSFDLPLNQPDNPERGEESLDARLTLDWHPTERFRANFKYAYTDFENDGNRTIVS